MDILGLDTQKACDKSIEIELLSPVDQKSTGIFISILGKDSKVCQDYNRDQMDEYLRKAHRAKKRGKEDELQTIAKLEKVNISQSVNCMTEWRQTKDVGSRKMDNSKPTITFGKEELEFNQANARKLLERLPWIALQIDDSREDLSLFMQS